MDWGDKGDHIIYFCSLRSDGFERIHIMVDGPNAPPAGSDLSCCGISSADWQRSELNESPFDPEITLKEWCPACVVGLADMVRKEH